MSDTNWISVKDRLPEKPGKYRIRLEGIGYVDNCHIAGIETQPPPHITHWNTQPLSEPPVAEQEADHDR